MQGMKYLGIGLVTINSANEPVNKKRVESLAWPMVMIMWDSSDFSYIVTCWNR